MWGSRGGWPTRCQSPQPTKSETEEARLLGKQTGSSSAGHTPDPTFCHPLFPSADGPALERRSRNAASSRLYLSSCSAPALKTCNCPFSEITALLCTSNLAPRLESGIETKIWHPSCLGSGLGSTITTRRSYRSTLMTYDHIDHYLADLSILCPNRLGNTQCNILIQ